MDADVLLYLLFDAAVNSYSPDVERLLVAVGGKTCGE